MAIWIPCDAAKRPREPFCTSKRAIENGSLWERELPSCTGNAIPEKRISLKRSLRAQGRLEARTPKEGTPKTNRFQSLTCVCKMLQSSQMLSPLARSRRRSSSLTLVSWTLYHTINAPTATKMTAIKTIAHGCPNNHSKRLMLLIIIRHYNVSDAVVSASGYIIW